MTESTTEHLARTDRAIERQDRREEVDRVSDTPDTDAAINGEGLFHERLILAARKLERERDTIKAELTSARAAIKDFLQWYRDVTNNGVYLDHDRERVWREACK